MLIISNTDMYTISIKSLIADYDRKTFVNLYQPIVGYAAMAIYFSLLAEGEMYPVKFHQMHRSLFEKMQIPAGVFAEEKKKLEALGLLKTSLLVKDDLKYYTYEIYAPKTPAKFFSDPLLFGLLVNFVGEVNAQKIKSVYLKKDQQAEGKDVSTTFGEVFNPNLTDNNFSSLFSPKEDSIINRVQSKIDSQFNYAAFISFIKQNSQISEYVFNKHSLKTISRLAALYGISEESAAIYVVDCYDPDGEPGKKIDYEKLKKRFEDDNHFPNFRSFNKENNISSKSNLASKINLMETVSCRDYLRVKQNNTMPSSADMRLINDLSEKFGLPNPVINAIVDFVLVKQDNTLPRAYTEKIASSVARENLKTAYDTMGYLRKINSNNKRNNNYSKNLNIKIENDKPLENIEPVKENKDGSSLDGEEDDEDWNEFIKDFDNIN